ncbi:MAG: CAP domain-containing protein [Xenococcus sp. (in: cyanobacteria)]
MTKPEELSTPRITKPLYEGAEVVEVSNFRPKAEVIIFSDQDGEIGKGSCWFGKCTFALYPGLKLKSGHKITATQTFNKVTSAPTRDEDAVIVKEIPADLSANEKLNQPSIEPPLYECQRIVSVKNVLEGAHVRVFSPPDNKYPPPFGSIKTPWNYARPRTTELKLNQEVAANQELVFSSARSSPSEPAKAEPTPREMEEKHKPVLNEGDLVVGSDAIGVENLIVGAKVKIYYENQSTKKQEILVQTIAPWVNTVFQVQPLKAEWANCQECIKASQSLCEKYWSESDGKTVKDFLEEPEIRGPICPGSFAITVCNALPKNSTLKVFLKGKSNPIADQGAIDYCTTVTLGSTLTLKDGDEIYVKKELGKLSASSADYPVKAQSDAMFEIGNGIFCKQCVGQENNPVFVRDKLTKISGPVFKAKMCGTESAKVEILEPNGAPVETITLEELKGKKGYFEGKWDWSNIGWQNPQDITTGKYTAKFTIYSIGGGSVKRETKHFYVFKQGCVELEVLCAHNKYRELVNTENPSIPPLDPLTWSDQLADGAQQWADYLYNKKKGQIEHSQTRLGENIYKGSSSYTQAVNEWASEKRCFKNGTFPFIYSGQCDNERVWFNDDWTTCGNLPLKEQWRCIGHYSQIVWRGTKQVGCGMANGIVVCRYSPAGNVDDQKAY